MDLANKAHAVYMNSTCKYRPLACNSHQAAHPRYALHQRWGPTTLALAIGTETDGTAEAGGTSVRTNHGQIIWEVAHGEMV